MGKTLDKLFRFENKIKKWIEDNRIKWYFVLFFVGVLLGISSGILLRGTIIIRYGFLFGLGLITVEFFSGGSGIDEVRNEL